MKSRPKTIVNLTRGNVVCLHTTIADRPLVRMRGLLGRAELPDDEGLLLKPTPSVHTAFMHMPIDVVFLDAEFGVLKVVTALSPWRAASARGARMALELAAGQASARCVVPGDALGLVDVTNADEYDAGARAMEWRPAADASEQRPRVLLLAPERRFRAVAGALLSQYGCDVETGEATGDVVELARRAVADVVVLDAGNFPAEAARKAAGIQAMEPRVGLVVVGDTALYARSGVLVLSKWDSFGRIYEAVQEARVDYARRGL